MSVTVTSGRPMPIELDLIPGATPLDPDTIAGLRPAHIATQADLNAAEAANILAALNWARRARTDTVLRRDYVQRLHKQMFGDVWRWAGTWRRLETTIGVDPLTIATRVEQLLDDVRHWVANASFEPHEIAVRLHHQMVLIHPFPNGNGRHTRLMADLLLKQLEREPFTWGGGALSSADDARTRYIAALRSADRGDLQPLLVFARSQL